MSPALRPAQGVSLAGRPTLAGEGMRGCMPRGESPSGKRRLPVRVAGLGDDITIPRGTSGGLVGLARPESTIIWTHHSALPQSSIGVTQSRWLGGRGLYQTADIPAISACHPPVAGNTPLDPDSSTPDPPTLDPPTLDPSTLDPSTQHASNAHYHAQHRPIPVAALFLPGVYQDQVLTWLALADAAAADILAGRRPRPVPTRVIGQDQMQPWARGTVWDCADPAACTPVERSTRKTPVPGRCINRAALRRIARILGWHDTDIVDQAGEGGVETRSDCALETVLTFHHDSLLDHLPAAQTGVAAHIEEKWTDAPVRHLPFVPCRMQPRGVVEQARSRLLPDGSVEEYFKPRVTTDGSFGGPDSQNAGVPDSERAVVLPSVQSLGRGWAICASAYRGEPTSEGGDASVQGYCIDAESAYSFVPVQYADLWQQCFTWWDADGTAGVAIDRRMGFGGAFAPNRFERISTLCAAYAQHLQAEFDELQPPPLCAQRWSADRRALQEEGKLPAGDAQLHPRFLQVYLDDFTGCCADDTVVPPESVRDITIDYRHMRGAGCTPAALCSRVHVHAQLVMLALRTAGLVAAPHKVVCGTPLPALGLIFDGESGLITCPAGKRDAVSAICRQTLASTTTDLRVDRTSAARLVGRLCNLSQVAPDLRPLLEAGYRLTNAGPHAARSGSTIALRNGSPAYVGWTRLLEAAPAILADSTGVAMAPRRLFPGRLTAGTLSAVTDASGDDGLGGFAWLAGCPATVFVFSEAWPPSICDALAASADPVQAALRRSGDASAAPYFSVAAAELFTATILPDLVGRVTTVRRTYTLSPMPQRPLAPSTRCAVVTARWPRYCGPPPLPTHPCLVYTSPGR